MGADSKIQWTHHTFNPWWGCMRVSPGCEHCYAELFDRFVNAKSPHWGPRAPRRFFAEKHWLEPLQWDLDAKAAGERRRVFCASMADVFEDRPELAPWRMRLFHLIRRTPNLDWLLLTKRPEHILKGVSQAMCTVRGTVDAFDDTLIALSEWIAGKVPLPNVWLGTTVEDQQRANERSRELLKVLAVVHFLSCEPLLEPVNLKGAGALGNEFGKGPKVDWVIVGGESGGKARPFNVAWAYSLLKQCRRASVACFVKQLGANTIDRNDAGFEAEHDVWAEGPEKGLPTRPESWPSTGWKRVEDNIGDEYQGAPVRVHLRDSAGGEPAEWPLALRVREFPRAAA